MGPELALALAAGGTAAQMIGARQQQRQQRAILNQSMDQTAKTQREATSQVLDEAKKFSPEARMQAMQDAEKSAYDQAQTDVGGGAAANIPTAHGNVSTDYLKAQADRALSEGNRLTAMAREAAKIRAPGSLQNAEALRRASLTGDLASRFATNRNMASAAQQDAASVDAPWYSDLGKIASAVGSASLMMPGASAAPAAIGATNPALIDSALGSAGYGASSASVPWWSRAIAGAPRIRF